MISEEEATLVSVLILILGSCQLLSQQRHRRWWVRPRIAERDSCGSAVTSLLHSLQDHREADQDPLHFSLPMDNGSFGALLEMVTPRIKRKDTRYRKAISPGDRLALTLRYLVTGESFSSLEKVYRFPKSTISQIIPDTCDAIYQVLRPEFLKVPETQEDWLKISKQFEDTRHFPHCLGAVVGKEVIVLQPLNAAQQPDSGDQSCPVSLLALVDADCKFTYLDVRCHGPSGRPFFTGSSLCNGVEHDTFNLPPASALPQRRKQIPFVFAGDETCPLMPYFMKPYPGNQLSPENMIFNYRLSLARRCADETFSILTRRFQIFSNPLFLRPENAVKIVLACCALHNFLSSTSASRRVYAAPEREEEEAPENREEEEESAEDSNGVGLRSVGNCWAPLPDHPAQGTEGAHAVRDELCQYLSIDGAIPGQWDNLRH